MGYEKQKFIEIWDKVAPTFGKIGPKYWDEFGKRLVELSSIKEGAKVLDIGMGRGASLFPAIEEIGEDGYAIGIDISEVMVRETYNDILMEHIENAKVLRMNAESLDFYDNYFNNIICGFGIGYILFSDNKLTEILRVLREGGQVGFSIWGVQEDQKWLAKINNKYLQSSSCNEEKDKNSNDLKFNTTDGIKSILENSGFTNVKVYEENTEVVYSSKEEWWQEMWSNAARGVFEQVESFGEDKLEEYKKDIFNGLNKYKKGEKFYFNMPVIYAFGEKRGE
ncbi:class I SAM-dependent methyltransferase [Clostridium lundense]|uniref:class I SAM-dependent methyltransferase n=1 Tax=Clostridium lundense TaxID=319475 RepID=UPI000489B539|nr:class I SAM-dependent methyltransferase [Clostridium lundense]